MNSFQHLYPIASDDDGEEEDEEEEGESEEEEEEEVDVAPPTKVGFVPLNLIRDQLIS